MSTASYGLDPQALTCWKDIAHYLGKGVRTVQRWERELGLPVRRPQGALGSSLKSPVIADPRDLEAWLKSRWTLRELKETETGETLPADTSEERESLELGIEQARELRLKMRAMQLQQLQLIVDLTESVRSLNETCRQIKAMRDISS